MLQIEAALNSTISVCDRLTKDIQSGKIHNLKTLKEEIDCLSDNAILAKQIVNSDHPLMQKHHNDQFVLNYHMKVDYVQLQQMPIVAFTQHELKPLKKESFLRGLVLGLLSMAIAFCLYQIIH